MINLGYLFAHARKIFANQITINPITSVCSINCLPDIRPIIATMITITHQRVLTVNAVRVDRVIFMPHLNIPSIQQADQKPFFWNPLWFLYAPTDLYRAYICSLICLFATQNIQDFRRSFGEAI